MKTAPLKRSRSSPRESDSPKAVTRGRRRIKAGPGARGSWSKKPVNGLFNDSGEINVNVMLGLLFEFLKDYDHSTAMGD